MIISAVAHAVQDGVQSVVFGNGWLALTAVLVVSSVAVVVRLTGGVRV